MEVSPIILNHSQNVVPLLLTKQRRMDFKGVDFSEENKIAFINQINLCPIVEHIEIVDSTHSGDWPQVIFQGNIAHFHCYRTGMTNFPIPIGGGAMIYQFLFDDLNNGLDTLPTEWENLPRLRYLYLRRNGYTSAQVNSLAQQFSDLVDQGMGSLFNNNTLFLNRVGLGTDNEPLTVVPNGWTQEAGRIVRGEQKIYHN